jgi:hypothetical protein
MLRVFCYLSATQNCTAVCEFDCTASATDAVRPRIRQVTLTLTVALEGPEGLVLAADSRGTVGDPSDYDR